MESEERYAPVGKVSIIDAETGETLVDTHNMIVKEGRRLIAKAVFGGTDDDPAISKAKFKFFYEQNDDSITVAGTTLKSMTASYTPIYRKLQDVVYVNSEDVPVSDDAISFSDNNNHKIKISFDDLTAPTKATATVNKDGALEYSYAGVSGTDVVFKYSDDTDAIRDGAVPAAYYLKGSFSSDKKTFSITTFTAPYSVIFTPDAADSATDESMKIHIGCAISFDKTNGSTADYDPIYAIGLVYDNDGDGTPDTLFSRAAFDPVYMRKNRTYVVHYTIYF